MAGRWPARDECFRSRARRARACALATIRNLGSRPVGGPADDRMRPQAIAHRPAGYMPARPWKQQPRRRDRFRRSSSRARLTCVRSRRAGPTVGARDRGRQRGGPAELIPRDPRAHSIAVLARVRADLEPNHWKRRRCVRLGGARVVLLASVASSVSAPRGEGPRLTALRRPAPVGSPRWRRRWSGTGSRLGRRRRS